MEKSDIFREATIKICGYLEIEKGLFDVLHELRQTMPVSRMSIQHYDEHSGTMRTIATATRKRSANIDQIIPLTKKARHQAKTKFFDGLHAHSNARQFKRVYLFDHPEKDKFAHEMTKFYKVTPSSLMVLSLESGDRLLGSLAMASEGPDKFTIEHAELIEILSEPFAIALSNTLKHREILHLKDLLADDNKYLRRELRRLTDHQIIGADFGLKGVMQHVQQVATLDSPVLLLGETGVGKDVIANTIHSSSTRSDGPFVSVNCGAIPETLIDSELFGHEKGAFTGALSQKKGRFERAHNGTIFLDEIGELPLQAQVRLLRVLQTKEIERVGGTKTVPVDIRIIAATNRKLEEMVKEGLFREDLWFRINVFPIWIPPVRERRSDIPALIHHFIKEKSKELKLLSKTSQIPQDQLDYLMEYHWPGNVRELQNVVERALIVNQAGPLSFDFLNMPQSGAQAGQGDPANVSDNLDQAMADHIKRVLEKTNGKVHGPGGAADLLGINSNTLRARMKKLGIRFGKDAV